MIEPTATGRAIAQPPINIHVHGELGDKDRARLLKILEREKPVPAQPKATTPFKPGYKTTEMWLGILTSIGALAATATNNLPPRYAAAAGIVSYFAYALSRGIAKH